MVTANDDRFHFDAMSDRWWETETCWFSFMVPERRLGGWLYAMIRPNIGTVAGGAWIWDDSAHLPWEVLYSANHSAARLEPGSDLRDVTFRTGMWVRMLQPLRSYAFGYADDDRLRIDLRFDAIMAPHALTSERSPLRRASHFDQFGRVHGSIELLGERIAVDSISMRDRSWGPRVEYRVQKTAYVTGVTPSGVGFLALTDGSEPRESVTHGFVLRDGVASDVVEGSRHVHRDRKKGWIVGVEIQLVDRERRVMRASGRPRSRIIVNRHLAIDCNSLVEWMIDGDTGWGEDQDLWPVHAWAAARRTHVVAPSRR